MSSHVGILMARGAIDGPPDDILAKCEPKLLPGYWVEDLRGADGVRYVNPKQRLSLIWSVAQEYDGKWWQHVSLAHPARLPTWDELVTIKEWLIGTDVDAYQVIPKRSSYVNIHPNCLHLFRCLDGDALPDFSAGSGSLPGHLESSRAVAVGSEDRTS